MAWHINVAAAKALGIKPRPTIMAMQPFMPGRTRCRSKAGTIGEGLITNALPSAIGGNAHGIEQRCPVFPKPVLSLEVLPTTSTSELLLGRMDELASTLVVEVCKQIRSNVSRNRCIVLESSGKQCPRTTPSLSAS